MAGRKIIIIDDDKMVRKLFIQKLTDSRIGVEPAGEKRDTSLFSKTWGAAYGVRSKTEAFYCVLKMNLSRFTFYPFSTRF